MDETRNNNTGISWKWLAGILVTAVLTFAAYNWNRLEDRVQAAEERTTQLTAEQAEIHAVSISRFEEVIRRLDRIERTLDQTRVQSRLYNPETRPPVDDTPKASSDHGFPTTEGLKRRPK